MSQSYLNIEDFDISSTESTGGVTGSARVLTKISKTPYQLKPSILSAKRLRRLKASGTDRENFGEVISAALSRALTGSDKEGSAELVPEVSLVYDAEKKEVLVASRYFKKSIGKSLDDYAETNRNAPHPKHHVKVSFASSGESGGKSTLYLGGKDDALLRKDLARALAVSVLSGDHDVNPGNMMVVEDATGAHRMARIDFGHAFNDLLNAPKMFGGRVRNKGNQVLDFLNREELSNAIPGQRIPKLWRDYDGIVPSSELAAAFKEMSKPSQDISRGIENAKAQFASLITDLQKDSKGNKKALDHIKKSLIAINNNVSAKISSKEDVTQVLNKTFENLEAFYTKGQGQMADAAKLMELQLNVDKLIVSPNDAALQIEIQKSYAELTRVHGIARTNGKDGIEWIKNDKDSKAFKGSLEAFIKIRRKDLKREVLKFQELSQVVEQVPIKPAPVEKPLDIIQQPELSTITNPPTPLLGVDNEYVIESIKFKYVQTAALGVSNTQPKDPKLPVPTIDETVQFMQSLSPLGPGSQVGDLAKKAEDLKKRMSTQSSKAQEEDPKLNADYALFCAAAHTKVREYHMNCSAYFTTQLDNNSLPQEARRQFAEMRDIANHCAEVATNDAAINTKIAIGLQAQAQQKLISKSPVAEEAKIVAGTVRAYVLEANQREAERAMGRTSFVSKVLQRGGADTRREL